MKYEKLKSFDLNSIKSQEDADSWKETVINCDKDDILKYINFLRWQQYNDADIKYMQKIVHFLSYDEIMDIEMENQDILTGDTEDLIINNIVEAEEPMSNPINIISPEGIETYSLKAVLDDSFEKVMIVSDKEGKLYKFGFIVIQDVKGIEYFAYELYEEPQEYYSQIVDAEVGTRVNVYADIVEENQVLKTYTKIDKFVDELNFILTKKTNQGVLSPIYQGTYTILKKEEVLSSEGISEDRLASQMNKFKNEMAKKLGIKPQDVDVDGTVEDFEPIVDDEEDPTSKYTKEYFEDDFTFTKPYYFSIETPEEDDWYNPLTQSILNFHVDNWEYLNDEYIEEVYFMLSEKFGYCEKMEGIWAIDNTKLESVLRTIVRAGGKVKANDENASMFLQRFLRQEKLERILKVSKNFRVVKKIKTRKDVEEFVKDSGTELYHQIGQTLTAILEGTSRLFGEGHIVFDSDHKLVICEIDDELDLVSASNFAIDNSYKRFYVIEKDKYTEYDAWYKETLKTEVDPREKRKMADSEPKVFTKENLDEIESNDDEKVYMAEDPYDVLFDCDEEQDVVIVGTQFQDDCDFEITDDYSGFELLYNGEKTSEYSFHTDGFCKIVPLVDFIKNEDCLNHRDDGGKFKPSDITDADVELSVIRNFKGKIVLKCQRNDTNEFIVPPSGYIWHHRLGDDVHIKVIVDVQGSGQVKDLTDELYEELKVTYVRERKLKIVLNDEDMTSSNEDFELRVQVISNKNIKGFSPYEDGEWEKTKDYSGKDIHDIISKVNKDYGITEMEDEEIDI